MCGGSSSSASPGFRHRAPLEQQALPEVLIHGTAVPSSTQSLPAGAPSPLLYSRTHSPMARRPASVQYASTAAPQPVAQRPVSPSETLRSGLGYTTSTISPVTLPSPAASSNVTASPPRHCRSLSPVRVTTMGVAPAPLGADTRATGVFGAPPTPLSEMRAISVFGAPPTPLGETRPTAAPPPPVLACASPAAMERRSNSARRPVRVITVPQRTQSAGPAPAPTPATSASIGGGAGSCGSSIQGSCSGSEELHRWIPASQTFRPGGNGTTSPVAVTLGSAQASPAMVAPLSSGTNVVTAVTTIAPSPASSVAACTMGVEAPPVMQEETARQIVREGLERSEAASVFAREVALRLAEQEEQTNAMLQGLASAVERRRVLEDQVRAQVLATGASGEWTSWRQDDERRGDSSMFSFAPTVPSDSEVSNLWAAPDMAGLSQLGSAESMAFSGHSPYPPPPPLNPPPPPELQQDLPNLGLYQPQQQQQQHAHAQPQQLRAPPLQDEESDPAPAQAISAAAATTASGSSAFSNAISSSASTKHAGGLTPSTAPSSHQRFAWESQAAEEGRGSGSSGAIASCDASLPMGHPSGSSSAASDAARLQLEAAEMVADRARWLADDMQREVQALRTKQMGGTTRKPAVLPPGANPAEQQRHSELVEKLADRAKWLSDDLHQEFIALQEHLPGPAGGDEFMPELRVESPKVAKATVYVVPPPFLDPAMSSEMSAADQRGQQPQQQPPPQQSYSSSSLGEAGAEMSTRLRGELPRSSESPLPRAHVLVVPPRNKAEEEARRAPQAAHRASDLPADPQPQPASYPHSHSHGHRARATDRHREAHGAAASGRPGASLGRHSDSSAHAVRLPSPSRAQAQDRDRQRGSSSEALSRPTRVMRQTESSQARRGDASRSASPARSRARQTAAGGLAPSPARGSPVAGAQAHGAEGLSSPQGAGSGAAAVAAAAAAGHMGGPASSHAPPLMAGAALRRTQSLEQRPWRASSVPPSILEEDGTESELLEDGTESERSHTRHHPRPVASPKQRAASRSRVAGAASVAAAAAAAAPGSAVASAIVSAMQRAPTPAPSRGAAARAPTPAPGAENRASEGPRFATAERVMRRSRSAPPPGRVHSRARLLGVAAAGPGRRGLHAGASAAPTRTNSRGPAQPPHLQQRGTPGHARAMATAPDTAASVEKAAVATRPPSAPASPKRAASPFGRAMGRGGRGASGSRGPASDRERSVSHSRGSTPLQSRRALAQINAEKLEELRAAMQTEVSSAEEELSAQRSHRLATMRGLRAEVELGLGFFREEAAVCAAEGRRRGQEEWTAKRLSSQAAWRTALRAEDEAMRAKSESLENELNVWKSWSTHLQATEELTDAEEAEYRKVLRTEESAFSRREELAELAAAAAAASAAPPRVMRGALDSRRRPAPAAR